MKNRTSVAAAANVVVLAFALSMPVGANAGTTSAGRLAPAAASSAVSSTFECVTPASQSANVTLECPNEYALPTREPAIAVDPNDPEHIVTASLNEKWPNQTIQVATSFDGGKGWTIGDIPRRSGTMNWDPWLTFDLRRGTVVLAFELDRAGPGRGGVGATSSTRTLR